MYGAEGGEYNTGVSSLDGVGVSRRGKLPSLGHGVEGGIVKNKLPVVLEKEELR